jgi:hypothetical protein
MRIDEIIAEGISPENIAKLNKLRDLGNNRLADQIRIQLGRINDWDAAAEEARDVLNRQDRAKRAKQDKMNDRDAEQPKKAVVVKKDDGPGRGKYTKYKDGSDRKSVQAPSYDFKPDKGDGTGTGAKIAKAINPLSDLDATDFGTVATSAARKARSKMKNLGSFARQATEKR